jgi:hypothetical protein
MGNPVGDYVLSDNYGPVPRKPITTLGGAMCAAKHRAILWGRIVYIDGPRSLKFRRWEVWPCGKVRGRRYKDPVGPPR